MELYAKGQLSFLILTCMQDRDFYGLDIISEISERSNGRINLKKPSVYSNLTRMEKQGYITSYLRSSDFGPNRKYYSLTEQGRAFYQELKEYFERNNIDVFKDFSDGETAQASSPVQNMNFLSQDNNVEQSKPILAETVAQDAVEEKEEDEDFFDFSFASEKDDEEMKSSENASEAEDNERVEMPIENEIKDEQSEVEMPVSPVVDADKEEISNNYSIKQALLQQTAQNQEEKAETTDGGVFLSQESADEYNKRIYDISKDINRYKKKRSFAEDQISMVNTNALAESQERQKTNIEDFKNALLVNKTKYQDRLNKEDFDKQMGYRYERTSLLESAAKEEKKEEIKNDAVFITSRISESDVEKPRKIEPPQLKIISESARESKLPAPKRDSSIDPSHKEILSNLYARTRDNSADEVREDAIYDYNDLKDYYTNQDISFNIYQKPAKKLKHNTNKLYLTVSLLTLLCAMVLSTVTFFVVFGLDMLTDSTTCLYWILPCIFVVDVIWKLYKYKATSGWLPRKILPQWAMWLIYIVLSGAIIGVNFIFGFKPESFDLYATSILLPLVMAFVLVPFKYYVNRIAIVKFWK